MKILTPAQIQELDRRTVAECSIPSLSLMQKAGEGVASAIMDVLRKRNLPPRVGIFTGKGNNGGDGFCAAWVLASHGISCKVFALFPPRELTKDAAYYYRKANASKKVKIISVATGYLLQKYIPQIQDCAVVVDAIMGTGFRGRPEGIIAEAIDHINSANGFILAVDVPSGLDAATGKAQLSVVADLTVTMGFCKTGFLMEDAMNHVGSLHVVDIGIPARLSNSVSASFQLLDRHLVRNLLPRRLRISHKGNYGHLLIVGGACGMSGAAILSGKAALRTGSGLVSVACPASSQPIVAASCPEIMTLALPENSQRTASAAAVKTLKDAVHSGRFDAVVLGPGLGRNKDTEELTSAILREFDVPLVVDADALYAIAQTHLDLRHAKSKKIILTPHLGEFARLVGHNVDDVRNHLWENVAQYAQKIQHTVAAKSYITYITGPGPESLISTAGNPGMATAGMGDVLSGVIGSFLGQGFSPTAAAAAGAFVHGSAGDLAAEIKGYHGLIASDVIEAIPNAINNLQTVVSAASPAIGGDFA